MSEGLIESFSTILLLKWMPVEEDGRRLNKGLFSVQELTARRMDKQPASKRRGGVSAAPFKNVTIATG
jgi:hypothetical protein